MIKYIIISFFLFAQLNFAIGQVRSNVSFYPTTNNSRFERICDSIHIINRAIIKPAGFEDSCQRYDFFVFMQKADENSMKVSVTFIEPPFRKVPDRMKAYIRSIFETYGNTVNPSNRDNSIFSKAFLVSCLKDAPYKFATADRDLFFENYIYSPLRVDQHIFYREFVKDKFYRMDLFF